MEGVKPRPLRISAAWVSALSASSSSSLSKISNNLKERKSLGHSVYLLKAELCSSRDHVLCQATNFFLSSGIIYIYCTLYGNILQIIEPATFHSLTLKLVTCQVVLHVVN